VKDGLPEMIRRRARELGFDDCRFTTALPPDHGPEFQTWLAARYHGDMAYLERNASKRLNPSLVLPNARSLIVVAATYHKPESSPTLRPSTRRGVVARYARYRDYHNVLAQQLEALVQFVNNVGEGTQRSLWYVDTGPILERDLAQRAGVGFVGKHTNLISRTLGNWIFLAEIITTLDLKPDAPEKNRCGSCTRCLEACPTAAIRAPFQLDARRCISYLTIELKGSIPIEWREAIGNRIYGCDDCLAACPWNRFARESNLMKSHALPELDSPDLIDLLRLDDAGFKARFAGTPMLRTKRRGLIRNVCVALGNVGDESALPDLQRAASDPEPLIAEHAQWAIERIQSRTKRAN
jgi:epoxyqueuosine reductase